MNTALELLLASLSGDSSTLTTQSVIGWRPPTG